MTMVAIRAYVILRSAYFFKKRSLQFQIDAYLVVGDAVAVVVRDLVCDVVFVVVAELVAVDDSVVVADVVRVVLGVDKAQVSKVPSTYEDSTWLSMPTVVSQSASSFRAPPMEHVSPVLKPGRYFPISFLRFAELAAHVFASSNTDSPSTTEPHANEASSPQASSALLM